MDTSLTQNEADYSQTISTDGNYLVLARKYRPTQLNQLIGQDLLIKTLGSGIKNGRLGHAFILTGIRGTGKTTTARLIGRCLNCTGLDGNSPPTTEPCGSCPSCIAISQDRHMDVIEIDAASKTSVDDIREIIESARYKAVSARYKIFIIDEVHMLSKSAFNALLKTLEEPPAHVKFIFATTEIHKVPLTILSRCLRFDLRPISKEKLVDHFKNICRNENVTYDEESLLILAKAAQGSARDGLSLLEQAMTQERQNDGNAHLNVEHIRTLLGFTNKDQLLSLVSSLLEGNIINSLSQLRNLYSYGTDPLTLLNELIELTYWLSCLKVDQNLAEKTAIQPEDISYATQLIEKIDVPTLGRLWQMFLKGSSELRLSSIPEQALEMLCIRIAYMACIPPLHEILDTLQKKNF